MENNPNREVLSTGNSTLDRLLGGGLRVNRSVLLRGGPGTGKSTLAMQFLQAGIRADEECVFVSTEQTPAELRDNFAPYEFDLDHDRLTLTSLHARPGYTLDDDEEQLTVETLDGDQLVGEGYAAPFSSRYVTQLLGRYAPADRVVIDSLSGLRAMSDDDDVFRRGVLDLMRLLSDKFEATSLLVAEASSVGDPDQTTVVDPLEYNTHGVIRVRRERKGSGYRRLIEVVKMRGVAHDDRNYEFTFDEDGVRVVPSRRTSSVEITQQDRLSTGIEAFDALLGGGLPLGDSVLVEHDGRANVDTLLFTMAATALGEGMNMVLLPRVNLSPRRVDSLVAATPVGFDSGHELLDADRLFVLDALGAWENHKNVYNLRAEETEMVDRLRSIRETSTDEGLFLALNTEAKAHVLGEEHLRRVRYWLQSAFLEAGDLLLDIHNPKVMTSRVAEFYTDAASQAIRTWFDDNDLQYVRLEKGIAGDVGRVKLMEFIDAYPFVRLR